MAANTNCRSFLQSLPCVFFFFRGSVKNWTLALPQDISIFTHQHAVARSLELGLKWQNDKGLSSPIWLQKLLRDCNKKKIISMLASIKHLTTQAAIILINSKYHFLTPRDLCSSCFWEVLVDSGIFRYSRAASRRSIALERKGLQENLSWSTIKILITKSSLL